MKKLKTDLFNLSPQQACLNIGCGSLSSIKRMGMLFVACFVWSTAAWADPNDYNPCGQYNDYMGNLCQYDKETEKIYPDGNPLSCSHCNKPDVALNAKTKFNPSSGGTGSSSTGGSGAAEGTD